ncbi:hypothetical protein DVJ83_15945 (plasmid) [Deinococcus wulumuqiensis]|uniref:Uncharacterized protein n=1 Tax=Deinococcus wulumuqiensis TaxID=980427 RepID=A0A345ILS4_9DEIO|nr:hypothetical protein [Deinococcus wulumuqiensis]AXH00647.1 hypothetical protein DVJ83_15945 [Deinococcus wulumuqiensis]
MTAQDKAVQALERAGEMMRLCLADPSDFRADLAARTFAHDARRATRPEPRHDRPGPVIRTRGQAASC